MVGFSAVAGARDQFEKGVPRQRFWERLGVRFDTVLALPPAVRAGDGSGSARDYPVIAMDCVPGKYPAPPALNELAQYLLRNILV